MKTALDKVLVRLRSRVGVNERTMECHPELLDRELARARAAAYRMAIDDVLEGLRDANACVVDRGPLTRLVDHLLVRDDLDVVSDVDLSALVSAVDASVEPEPKA